MCMQGQFIVQVVDSLIKTDVQHIYVAYTP